MSFFDMLLFFVRQESITIYMLLLDNKMLVQDSTLIGNVKVNASLELTYYPSLEDSNKGNRLIIGRFT